MSLPLSVAIVDPTLTPSAGDFKPASRVETLDGLVVGVIWNSRVHGDKILKMVLGLLEERFRIRGVVFRRKPYLGNVAPEGILDEITANCDVAITGVGD